MILRLILGAVVGGLIGFGVYRIIGCSSGTCPITSSPWISTLVGVVMGLMFASGK